MSLRKDRSAAPIIPKHPRHQLPGRECRWHASNTKEIIHGYRRSCFAQPGADGRKKGHERPRQHSHRRRRTSRAFGQLLPDPGRPRPSRPRAVGQGGRGLRNHRWDSFTLNTPNWQTRLPGAEYHGDDPDGFMSRGEVVAYLEDYVERFHLPVRYGVRVERVEREKTSGVYLVRTSDGRRLSARNVVIATGLYQTPKVPRFGSALPPSIRQVHSDAYRNPEEL